MVVAEAGHPLEDGEWPGVVPVHEGVAGLWVLLDVVVDREAGQGLVQSLGRTGQEPAREVLRRADAAMYDAKRSGRRVRIEVAPRPRVHAPSAAGARSVVDVRSASLEPPAAAASAASRSSR